MIAEEEAALQVLQRGLLRPVSLTYGPEVKAGADSHSQKEAAELMLYSEMQALLEHDAAKYPIKESKKDKKVSSCFEAAVLRWAVGPSRIMV